MRATICLLIATSVARADTSVVPTSSTDCPAVLAKHPRVQKALDRVTNRPPGSLEADRRRMLYPAEELTVLGRAALPAMICAYPRAKLEENEVLLKAFASLDQRGACASQPALADALVDRGNPELLLLAAYTAGGLGCRGLAPRLRELLLQQNSSLQYAAIRGLERLDDPAVSPWLHEMLLRPDHEIGPGFVGNNSPATFPGRAPTMLHASVRRLIAQLEAEHPDTVLHDQ